MTHQPDRLGVISFELADADGEIHNYEVHPHDAETGQVIVWRLLALGAEPLGRLAQGALESGALVEQLTETYQTGGAAALMELDTTELAKSLDLAGMGEAIGQVLAQGKAPELTREILKQTHRDGQPLNTSVAFGNAYRRNYGEMIAAVWKVVGINRFLPLPGIS